MAGRERVDRGSGQARVLRMAFTDPDQERAVIAEFNAARDEEYTEMLDRLPELHALTWLTDRGVARTRVAGQRIRWRGR